MKKTVCILFAAILCLFSCLSRADEQISLNGTFSNSSESASFSLDFFEKGRDYYFVSSLLPDASFRFDGEDFFRLFRSLLQWFQIPVTESLPEKVKQMDKSLDLWIRSLPAQEEKGLYSGSFFDHASSMKQYYFSLRQLFESMEVQYSCPDLSFKDISVSLKRFDDGKYDVYSVFDDREDEVLSLTVDRMAEELPSLRFLVRRNGNFDLFMFRLFRENDSLRILSERAYQSSVSGLPDESTLLLREEYLISAGAGRFQMQGRTGTIQNGWMLTAAMDQNRPDNPTLMISLSFPETPDLFLNMEAAAPSSENMQQFSLQTMDASDENRMSNDWFEWMSELFLFAAEIIPMLPADYQPLLLRFLYQ